MNKPSNITGVILAGGKGSRMYPLGTEYPKCILPICNRPLIEYQIEQMKKLNIKDIVIVIGYQGFKIVQQLGNGEKLGVTIRYVDQEEALGIAHAVGKLEQHIRNPFFLFLGDIFFITTQLQEIVEKFYQNSYNAVLATKIEPDTSAIMRNFAIIEDDSGLVKRVIEKPRHTVNKIKGCGLYLFDLHIFDAIRRTPRTAMRDEYEITDAIQILIDDGCSVKQLPVIDNDLNLTFPDDLLKINLEILRQRGDNSIIHEEASIPSTVSIKSSVIAKGVELSGNGMVENSIIFPNSTLKVNGRIKNTIITPKHHIYCHNL